MGSRREAPGTQEQAVSAKEEKPGALSAQLCSENHEKECRSERTYRGEASLRFHFDSLPKDNGSCGI
jgi:hypothetical protein